MYSHPSPGRCRSSLTPLMSPVLSAQATPVLILFILLLITLCRSAHAASAGLPPSLSRDAQLHRLDHLRKSMDILEGRHADAVGGKRREAFASEDMDGFSAGVGKFKEVFEVNKVPARSSSRGASVYGLDNALHPNEKEGYIVKGIGERAGHVSGQEVHTRKVSSFSVEEKVSLPLSKKDSEDTLTEDQMALYEELVLFNEEQRNQEEKEKELHVSIPPRSFSSHMEGVYLNASSQQRAVFEFQRAATPQAFYGWRWVAVHVYFHFPSIK